jgi:hypothetical protein
MGGVMKFGELAAQLRNMEVKLPSAIAGANGDGAAHREEDDDLARWAKDYAASAEGKRVSALIDVRLRRPLQERHVAALIKGLAAGMVPFLIERLAEAVAPLIARIAELEKKKGIASVAARVGELEQHAVKYCGVWNEEEIYAAGTLCTYQGGMWHCQDTNRGVRPGSGSTTWTLANKSRR